MISDFNEFFSVLLNKLEKDRIDIQEINNNVITHDYFIDEDHVNRILQIIFDICSSNEYCFSISRDKYAQINIIIFEKKSEEKFLLNLFTLMEKEINKKLEKKYISNVNFLRSLNIVPIIGPDGVGKTTLLTKVMESLNQKIFYKRFKKIVRRSIIYNIFQPINKRFLRKKLDKKPEKDQHDDIHYFLIILSGLGYYPYLFIKALYKKNLIILDRFFYDYFLENISFREKNTTLRKNWKFLIRFIPRAYWIIHLDAEAKTILSRKQELTEDDINKYRKLNFTLYLEKPSIIYLYVNTGLEFEQCKYIVLYSGINAKVFNKMLFDAKGEGKE